MVAHCLQLVDWSLFVALSCVICEPLYLSRFPINAFFGSLVLLISLRYEGAIVLCQIHGPAAIARIWSKFWRWMRTRFVKGEWLVSRRIRSGYQGVCASVA